MSVCQKVYESGWLCGERVMPRHPFCDSHERGLIDVIAPHARFHIGIDYQDGDTRVQDVQIVNRDDKAIATCHCENGTCMRSRMTKPLEEHRVYFEELAERHLLTLPERMGAK